MNNPRQDEQLEMMLSSIRAELQNALASRAEIDETIAKGRAMLVALERVKSPPPRPN